MRRATKKKPKEKRTTSVAIKLHLLTTAPQHIELTSLAVAVFRLMAQRLVERNVSIFIRLFFISFSLYFLFSLLFLPFRIRVHSYSLFYLLCSATCSTYKCETNLAQCSARRTNERTNEYSVTWKNSLKANERWRARTARAREPRQQSCRRSNDIATQCDVKNWNRSTAQCVWCVELWKRQRVVCANRIE